MVCLRSSWWCVFVSIVVHCSDRVSDGGRVPSFGLHFDYRSLCSAIMVMRRSVRRGHLMRVFGFMFS